MNNSYTEAVKVIKDFLSKGDPSVDIHDDVNLFETGILDSLQFMEIIFILEDVSQTTIDVSEFDVMSVSTMGRIKSDMLSHLI